jgi:hypothetical protein
MQASSLTGAPGRGIAASQSGSLISETAEGISLNSCGQKSACDQAESAVTKPDPEQRFHCHIPASKTLARLSHN